MDQTSFNEFKVNDIDKILLENAGLGLTAEFSFGIHEDENSITVQRRRSQLMEVNDDFDIQQVFKEINWNQRWIE